MEILDKNAMDELVNKVQLCDYPFSVHCLRLAILPCHEHCKHLFHPCNIQFWCRNTFRSLVEELKACGSAFYVRCPGFDRIEKEWPEFDPAVEAAELKEKTLLDRIAKLEAQVKEIKK
jgi:hypothetical protein